MNIEVGLHNEFEIVVRDAKTNKIKKSVKGYNIILSRFWSLFFTTSVSNLQWSHIHFGSGTVAPNAADTTLTSLIAAVACGSDVIDTSRYASEGIVSRKRSIRLQDTEYVGSVISEVGIGNSATSLLTKCLIKDGNGNPISITKSDSEIIDIYATFFAKFPLSYLNGGDIMLPLADGSSLIKTCTLQSGGGIFRAASYNVYYDKYQLQPNAITYYWINHCFSPGSPTVTFDVANKKATWAVPNVLAATYNDQGGIRSMLISDVVGLRVPGEWFTQSPITKEVIGTGDGVTTKFNTKFGLLKNDAAFKVHVNDVEVSVKNTLFDTIVPQANILPGIKFIDWPRNLTMVPFMSTLGDANAMGVGDIVFENPLYMYGVDTCKGQQTTLYSADSPAGPWTYVVGPNSGGSTAYAIPVAHKNKRYWKHPGSSVQGSRFSELNSVAFAAEKLIELNEAPPAGAVVTCTYNPDLIAKDANHVIHNAKINMTFGEYTP